MHGGPGASVWSRCVAEHGGSIRPCALHPGRCLLWFLGNLLRPKTVTPYARGGGQAPLAAPIRAAFPESEPAARNCAEPALRNDEVTMDRDLVAKVRRLDEYELRRLLILVRGLLLHLDGPPGDEEPSLPQGLTYRQETVKCGKPACTRCPHGPYWYAYWKEEGRTRKRYIGRHLPGEELEEVTPDLPPAEGNSVEHAEEAATGRRSDDG
jgi:hypothetical protein